MNTFEFQFAWGGKRSAFGIDVNAPTIEEVITKEIVKLSTLLDQITPLPWRCAEMDNDKVIPSIRIFGRRKHDPTKETCIGRLDFLRDARYAIHATNLLPELIAGLHQAVEALYNVPEVGCKYDQQHSDTHLAAAVELKELLAKAENLNRQSVPVQPDNQSNHHANGTNHP